jgi:hypothetical protein
MAAWNVDARIFLGFGCGVVLPWIVMAGREERIVFMS